jgi:hypothetical protein
MLTPNFRSLSDAGSGVISTPRIAANRCQIDPRFPALGFTVDSGGLPYFEVLLTTDRSLFDPVNAGRRNPSNFYASRQDSGLIRSDGTGAIYVLPTAVLREFSKAPEIYYTVVGYRGADASGPAMAHSHETLAQDAPSVSCTSDLHVAMSMDVLSVPVEKLRRIRHDGEHHEGYQAFGAEPEIDAATDRAEGEDGYGLSVSQSFETAYDESSYGMGYGASGHGGADYQAMDDGSDDGYQDGFDTPIASAHTASGLEEAAYHDDDLDGDAYRQATTAQESTYYAEAAAPAMLEDEDYTDESEEPKLAKATEEYDDGMGIESAVSLDADDEPSYEDLDAPPVPSATRAPASQPPPPQMAPPQFAPVTPPLPTARRPLNVQAKIELISRIAPYESGAAGYAAINPDGEYEGRFRNHPAKGRYHIGLSYGIVQFTQDSRSLGRLLAMMRDRNRAKFREVFGPDSDELVTVINSEGPSSSRVVGGRSARVQPVAGVDIWKEPWVARFKEAARANLFGTGVRQVFNGAQNELASGLYLDPTLPFAKWLDLITDRALAMVFDRAVQMGVTGSRRWIIEAVGPVKSPAYMQQAFAALNTDLASFQASTPGIQDDGGFGAKTHAALVSALRRSGKSPFPIPSRDQMLDAIVLRASSTAWARRTSELRTSNTFTDTEFEI